MVLDIVQELNLTVREAAFSESAYMLPFGLFILIFGPLADRHGTARRERLIWLRL
jgi:MFS family permease